MGYNIGVAFKTRGQRDQALAFLQAQGLPALLDSTPYELKQTLTTGDELGYPVKRIAAERVLGIHGTHISPSSWAAMAFAASRLEGAAPKIYVDSDDVLNVSEKEGADVRVDARGLHLTRPLPARAVVAGDLRLIERAAIEAWVAKADAALQAATPAPARRGPGAR